MRITKLAPSSRVQGRWLCTLEDGSVLRIGEGEVVSFALYAGMELNVETMEALAAAARTAKVREKALDLLTLRPMSRKELVDKLTARPRDKEKEPLSDRETAEEIADWLTDLGYLNDESYARTVVGHYARKGWGPAKIRDELYRRGVPRDVWDAALEELDGPEGAIDAFLEKKLRGADLSDPKAMKRASDALARRGFRWADISAGLRRFADGVGGTPPDMIE